MQHLHLLLSGCALLQSLLTEALLTYLLADTAENEALARAAAAVYLEESPCPFALNILAAAGIQLVNGCIERLELRQRREATDRQEPLATAV